jgi:26S proteasome regulatory subunit N2
MTICKNSFYCCNDNLIVSFSSIYRHPEQCPSVVSLLAESYNPHVRYGAAMALGIACAGTGLREAIALLEPLAKFDPVNFVRQGALVCIEIIFIFSTHEKIFSQKIFQN